MAVIAALLLLRGEFTPPSFGVSGFYRADSVQEWANRPISYAPQSTCQSCHQDKVRALNQAGKRGTSCQACHGPGQAHIAQGDEPIVDVSRELCALCHEELISRPNTQPQVDLATHGGQARCISCHDPHSPGLGGKAPKIPHTLEGRTDCLTCHGPGELKPFPSNHAGRTNNVCGSCHKGSQPTSGGSVQNLGPSALSGSPDNAALTATATSRQVAQIPQAR